MNNNFKHILEKLLHYWLSGDIIKDYYLFELYVKLSKIVYKHTKM